MSALGHVSGGHWYEALLYLAPVLAMVVGLWWSSRRADGGPDRADRDDADSGGAA